MRKILDIKVEAALLAIEEVFSETSVSAAETRDALSGIADEIEMKISTLKR